ncbi:hypothetical protein WR25_07811 [Diploscapter pachys]|uniref:Domain of unknown function DB domain-containing protein n=1 Tax=Diploscapter pachys TaxID=2018661 RepID=A0A2A2JPX8_9BILA|nr:hypothetical protein WR25_07811 [Diploscapter pachys]
MHVISICIVMVLKVLEDEMLGSPLVVVDGDNSNRFRSRELGVKVERQKRAEIESVKDKYRDLPLKVNEIILSPFDDNLRIFTKDAIYINEDLRKSSKLYEQMLIEGKGNSADIDDYFVTEPPARTTMASRIIEVLPKRWNTTSETSNSPISSTPSSLSTSLSGFIDTRVRKGLRLITLPPIKGARPPPYKHNEMKRRHIVLNISKKHERAKEKKLLDTTSSSSPRIKPLFDENLSSAIRFPAKPWQIPPPGRIAEISGGQQKNQDAEMAEQPRKGTFGLTALGNLPQTSASMDDDPIRFVPIGTAPSPLQFMPSFTPFRSPFNSAPQMRVIGIPAPFFPQPPIPAPAPAASSVHVSEPTLFMPRAINRRVGSFTRNREATPISLPTTNEDQIDDEIALKEFTNLDNEAPFKETLPNTDFSINEPTAFAEKDEFVLPEQTSKSKPFTIINTEGQSSPKNESPKFMKLKTFAISHPSLLNNFEATTSSQQLLNSSNQPRHRSGLPIMPIVTNNAQATSHLVENASKAYKASLTPNQKLELCCRKQNVNPTCQNFCNFDVFNDKTLVNVFFTAQCPGPQLGQAFDCASSKADHSDCCERIGLESFQGGKCMAFCRTHMTTPPNVLDYFVCLQVFEGIKGCYREYQYSHPNIFGD